MFKFRQIPLILSALLLMLPVAAQSASAKAITGGGLVVTKAEISGGQLVVEGTASRAGAGVSITGTNFKTVAGTDRRFALNALYRTDDCRLSLRGPGGLLNLVIGKCGVKGQTGANGANGKDGITGPKGDTGPAGAVGPAGPAGKDGAPGPEGPQGPAGIAGYSMLGAHLLKDGTTTSSVGVAYSSSGPFGYQLEFTRDIRNCIVNIDIKRDMLASDPQFYAYRYYVDTSISLGTMIFVPTKWNTFYSYFELAKPDATDIMLLCPNS